MIKIRNNNLENLGAKYIYDNLQKLPNSLYEIEF